MQEQVIHELPKDDELPNYCSRDGYRYKPNETKCPICLRERLSKKVEPPEVKWKKVLYERQPFDDNHLDNTFLDSLKSTEQAYNLKYHQVISKALEVCLAVTQVSLLMVLFEAMLNKKIQANTMIISLTISSVAGAFLYVILSTKIMKLHSILSNIKSACIIVGLIFLLAPVLKTFNSNYASDTIYALSFGLIIFHLITKNYAFIFEKNNTNDISVDNSTLSIFFLSVLLGSRFEDTLQVFTMWIINLMLFVFSRYLLKTIRVIQYNSTKQSHMLCSFVQDSSERVYQYLVFSIVIGVAVPVYKISKVLMIVYLSGNFFITFICPFWLIWLYQYKNVIEGPWDLPNVKQHEDQ